MMVREIPNHEINHVFRLHLMGPLMFRADLMLFGGDVPF